MSEVYKKAKSVFENELDTLVSKGDVNASDVEVIYKIVDIIKDLGEICKNDMEMNSMYDDDYSERRYGGRSNYYPHMGWYEGEYYNGRANRRSMNGGSYSNYGQSTSRNSEMMDKLRGLLNDANSDHERMMIKSWMNELSD